MDDENKYKEALKKVNMQYKEILSSKEYITGKRVLKLKYFLKKGRIFYIISKLIPNKKKKEYLVEKSNYNNENIFKDNEKYLNTDYDKDARVAIYTCNIGGYDSPKEPLITSEKCDYYFISDKEPEDLKTWKWIDANKFLKDMELSNVKKARYLKTHPDILFPNYKYSIFIDANIRCILDISDFLEKMNKNTGIAIHPHPYRDCIYKEGKACIYAKRGNSSIIKEQLEEYKKEGMPENFGLFETNILVREHENELCKRLMEDWWQEIKEKSERDQISFTYVLWKNNLLANDIGKIRDSILENEYVQVIPHLDEYEKTNK